MSMIIPLVNLKKQYDQVKPFVLSAIQGVLESQSFILGDAVAKFEADISRYCGVKHAIGVNSGTDAIYIALKALGIGAGDEVITSPWTYIATAMAIKMTGATPVFADIDTWTYNIDTVEIRPRISEKAKAIVPVHFYGQCADMDRICKLAEDNGLYVVEDAAQAMGATYRGEKAGSLGNIGCFSFYPSKNLGCYGDGGLVVTSSDDYADRIRDLRVPPLGGNSRLDAMQAAILSAKLPFLDDWNAKRRENADYYNKHLTHAVHPYVMRDNSHIYHQYVVRVDPDKRDQLIGWLAKHGIESRVYYPKAVHQYDEFGGCGSYPHTEMAVKSTLALPVVPELTENELAYVVDRFNAFWV